MLIALSFDNETQLCFTANLLNTGKGQKDTVMAPPIATEYLSVEESKFGDYNILEQEINEECETDLYHWRLKATDGRQ